MEDTTNKDPHIKDEDIVIPEGVVDEEIYKEWKKLFNRWSFSEERIRKVEVIRADKTINVVEVDYTAPTMYFNRYLNSIFDEELKKELRIKKAEWDTIRGNLAIMKQKAFGVMKTTKNDAIRDSILDVKKTEILELFGKFYNVTDVHRITVQEYKLECSLTVVEAFRIKHLEQIKELQDEYVKDYSEIRLTHKKSRLEELNELYVGRKNIYNTSKKAEDYKLLLQTIEQIKKEVEGDILTINGNININIEQTLISHIYQELMKGLAIKDIIISRVAARTNSNPLYLISRLHHSFYAKFNGFDVNEDFDLMSQIPLYPSQVVYNFDEVRNLNENKKHEKFQLSKLNDVIDENKDKIVNIKEDLLSRIRKNIINIEKEKEKIEKYQKGKPKNNNIQEIDYQDISDSESIK
jgi:hypothetical protein